MSDIFNMTKICPVCRKPITFETMTGEQLMNDLIGTELVVVQMCKDCKHQSEKQTQNYLKKNTYQRQGFNSSDVASQKSTRAKQG